MIKEILETNFIIYLVVRFSLTQEEVCYPHAISNIQIALFLRKDELKLTNMQTYLCHTEAISKSTRQLIMCLCIFFLLFLISIHWWFTIMYYFYAYSKFVFMSLTDIPLYLVLYTFGTYLYFVFVYMDVFCVFCCFYTPTHTAWCFSYNNLFVFPHVTCNVLSVLNNWNWEIKGVTF